MEALSYGEIVQQRDNVVADLMVALGISEVEALNVYDKLCDAAQGTP